MQTHLRYRGLLRIGAVLLQSARHGKRTAIRRSHRYISAAGCSLAPRRFTAGLCAALLFPCYLTAPADAQTVANCQPAPPFVNPAFSDGASGWSATTSAATARGQFVVGDIDGDGNDELVTLMNNQIQVWRWIQTGWSSAAPFPNARIASDFGSHLPPGNGVQFGPKSLQLADVEGSGQKDIVVYVAYSVDNPATSSGDQELVYHYNQSLATWTLLTKYSMIYTYTYSSGNVTIEQATAPLGPSYWFKAHTADAQESRLIVQLVTSPSPGFTFDVEQFVSGKWTSLPALGPNAWVTGSDGIANDCTQTAPGSYGLCIAFTDVNGDGIADAVFQGTHTWVVPSTAQTLFGGTPIKSSIPAVPLDPSGQALNATTLSGWQMAAVTGPSPETAKLLFPTPDGALNLYYWNTQSNDFVATSSPPFPPFFDSSTQAITTTITALPETSAPPFSSGASLGDKWFGITAVGATGVLWIAFAATYGGPPVAAEYAPPFYDTLTTAISGNAGFGPSGYSGFYRIALENGSPVLIARSANGIVSQVPGNTVVSFVTPPTDRGYPAYTSSQQAAYQYISANATGSNPDIRSLYPDPATPWAYLQQQVETMAAPAASSGISTADFQFVQKQTIDELTAIQSVNAFYNVTGQILTNTYLVKDAALEEVTDVLGLPSNPDVTGPILNDLTTALGGLGTVLSAAGSFMQLAKDANTLASIINRIQAASSLSYVLGAITGDTATYTAQTPPDLATGNYGLKLALDNLALGAATANSCHQLAALSDWNEAKYISDGILSGTIPLDLETQQDLLQASQELFRMNVWQTLTPSKWSSLVVKSGKVLVNGACSNCLFSGNSSYPLADSVQVNASCSQTFYTPFGLGNPFSLLVEDPTTHNYPNLNALNALFLPPPDGLGANPADVLLGRINWNIPYGGQDISFFNNTGYIPFSCNSGSFTPANPQLTPNVLRRPVAGDAAERLQGLIANVKANLTDAGLRDRLLVFLESAGSRLQQAQQHWNEPTETLRLLNYVIAQLQWHALQNASDSGAAQADAVETVGIRDSLINSMAVGVAQ